MHKRQTTHFDLKWANVIMTKYGQPKLTDFGLSLSVSAVYGTPPKNAGSIPFMAPEDYAYPEKKTKVFRRMFTRLG